MKLSDKRCAPCEAGTPPLSPAEIKKYLRELRGWKLIEGIRITKDYKFKSFPDTMAFVNRVALIAQEEGHHPDMKVSYSRVTVEFSTHAINGLSENDFILAAKIDS
ncbi:MAG TPA: 4a-hydroxytetrahydrobiopterin dehydratase [Patescibacteria group bacterium]|nr:4a-hydroxytetrahydrobiopterin dehydratase [Patescibacteria group bacterium]